MAADSAEPIDFLMAGIGDSNGNRLSGGKVYMYDAGTDKDRTTWDDSGKVTPSANPVILDSRGTALVFADGNYKMIVKTSEDVTLYTHDFLHYGHLGQGGFFIADDPRDGGLQGAGELVTDPDLDGGGGGGSGGAQITDGSAVNSPAFACGDTIPCHCGCCSPDAYRVTLSGYTGSSEGFNGVWRVPRRGGGRVGLYHKETPAGLILLDFSEIDCRGLRIKAGALVDSLTLNNAADCLGGGTVGALTWAICPMSMAPALDPIEVTFIGVQACGGCVRRVDGIPTSAFDNIDVSGINGTFSVDRSGCAWASNIPNVAGITADAWKIHPAIGCNDCGDCSLLNFESVTVGIGISIVGDKVRVSAIAYRSPWPASMNIGLFDGETPLLSGNNQCLDTLAMSNSLIGPCIPPGDGTFWPIAEGGMASVNWKP